ncbi:hypothetical protein AB0F81_19595 [Actinoplanes sp. NPDC024001]|uniref:hypothetical protein n=1 Tax=Actinoplanes sp. NPDC024001 TaxID=3154598 RepID=UPI00340D1241
MDSARPLRDVFADLTGAGRVAADPGELLRDQGHPALPDDLVAEAVVSYADTAPAEVAEHLAPYVTAHSVVGADAEAGEPAGWMDLLATAPAGAEPDDIDDLAPQTGDAGLDESLDFGGGAEFAPDEPVEEPIADEPVAEEAGDVLPAIEDEFLELGTDPIALDEDVTDWADDEPEAG